MEKDFMDSWLSLHSFAKVTRWREEGKAFLIHVLYAYRLLICGRGLDDGYYEIYFEVCFSYEAFVSCKFTDLYMIGFIRSFDSILLVYRSLKKRTPIQPKIHFSINSTKVPVYITDPPIRRAYILSSGKDMKKW